MRENTSKNGNEKLHVLPPQIFNDTTYVGVSKLISAYYFRYAILIKCNSLFYTLFASSPQVNIATNLIILSHRMGLIVSLGSMLNSLIEIEHLNSMIRSNKYPAILIGLQVLFRGSWMWATVRVSQAWYSKRWSGVLYKVCLKRGLWTLILWISLYLLDVSRIIYANIIKFCNKGVWRLPLSANCEQFGQHKKLKITQPFTDKCHYYPNSQTKIDANIC